MADWKKTVDEREPKGKPEIDVFPQQSTFNSDDMTAKDDDDEEAR